MNRHKNGFTLVELMVGVFIVSIGVIALYQMFITGSQLITEEYHRRLGLERAQAKMEIASYYKTQLDSIPRSLAGSFLEDLVPADEEDEDGIQAEYTMTITPSVDRDPHNGMPIYSDVALTYQWTEKSGKEQKITLRSYF